ncbi:GntR family transcriptional regulator [Streptomyces acidicola]|uniref:GntR family transcriptional regulator n=1 Tax=Streptomyces acidicola TaxID=2596892 RepID=A0A5N8WJL9_9ACTN|nr:GntR family transcriptional regulator [Streptomyces acidicola]MPY47427.1 GntR family transcriptional regulator [Streptomyces acidicola]
MLDYSWLNLVIDWQGAAGMTAGSDAVEQFERHDPRRAMEDAHLRLRALIDSGALPTDRDFSRAELAGFTGVSRGPLRGAIRLLREEGLIEAQPHRRYRIAQFDPWDVDAACGSRVLLEALAMRLSLPLLGRADLESAYHALLDMEADPEPGVSARWHRAHHRFHRSFTSNAPALLQARLVAGAEHGERHVRRLAQNGVPAQARIGQDHRRIHELVAARDHEAAIARTARHLAWAAVRLLNDTVPTFEPTATRAAVAFVAGGGSTEAAGTAPSRSHAHDQALTP